MRDASPSPVGDLGNYVPAMSSALRPRPLVELNAWGGARLVRGKRVLDVGCGYGRFALGVAPYATKVEGIDPDPGAIATARKAARRSGARNAHFAVGAAQRLPYRDCDFDVVILSWTL
jgi:ubiquinone/menaquinone biosynthesis C-methylase UbiE